MPIFLIDKPQFQRDPILNNHSLLLVEATNDMSFSPPETKYDVPF